MTTPAMLARAALVAVLLAGCGGTGLAPGAAGPSAPRTSVSAPVDATPRVSTAASATAVPDGPATPSRAPARSPTPRTERRARPATLVDVATYLGSVRPEGVTRLDGVAADLDGDGGPDVLLGGVRGGRGWTGTATWDGTAFRIVAEGRGGPGDRVEDLRLADVNGDGVEEVVLSTSGEGTGSVALWALPTPDRLVPLRARGGCHAGSHVYGAIGAELVRGDGDTLDVVATCDDAPLPVADWSSERYAWDGDAYAAL